MANRLLYKDRYLFDCYEWAKEGAREKTISKMLGISYPTFLSWEKKYALLRLGLKLGRMDYKRRRKAGKNRRSEIADYVYSRLSPDMQITWKKLMKVDHAKGGKEMIDAILENHGKTYRQHLFLYAFIHGNFSLTDACAKVGISIGAFEKWQRDDAEFTDLFRHANEAKKDFIETHLHKLIGNGSEAATIFASKTQLRDRGYDEKATLTVDVSGTVNHTALPFEEIRPYLSTQCQMEILEAMRKRKEIVSQTVANPIALIPANVLEAKFEERGEDE